MKFRTPYNHDSDIESFQTGLACSDPSRAQQHMRDECDINVMVKRFAGGMQIPTAPIDPEAFVFDEVFDFQAAMNKIRAARESFDQLPATLRRQLDYNPANLPAFIADPENLQQCQRLGLITVTKPATIDPVPDEGTEKTPPQSEVSQ